MQRAGRLGRARISADLRFLFGLPGFGRTIPVDTVMSAEIGLRGRSQDTCTFCRFEDWHSGNCSTGCTSARSRPVGGSALLPGFLSGRARRPEGRLRTARRERARPLANAAPSVAWASNANVMLELAFDLLGGSEFDPALFSRPFAHAALRKSELGGERSRRDRGGLIFEPRRRERFVVQASRIGHDRCNIGLECVGSKGLVGPTALLWALPDTSSGIYVALPGGAAHKPRAGVLLVVSALFMAVIGCGLLDPKRGTEAHVSGPPRKRKKPPPEGAGVRSRGDDVSGRGSLFIAWRRLALTGQPVEAPCARTRFS